MNNLTCRTYRKNVQIWTDDACKFVFGCGNPTLPSLFSFFLKLEKKKKLKADQHMILPVVSAEFML